VESFGILGIFKFESYVREACEVWWLGEFCGVGEIGGGYFDR